MNAQTPRAALLAVAEKPGRRFRLVNPQNKVVHVRFEHTPWGGAYYLKTVGPGVEWEVDLDLAVDLLRFLGGPIEISPLAGAAYEVERDGGGAS